MKRTTDQKVGGSNPSGRAIVSGLQRQTFFTLSYALVYSLGMVSSSARTVDEYLSSLSLERQQTISTIRKLINENLPTGFNEVMNWGMISYEIPLELSGPTYNGQPLMWVALSSQKQYCSLYLTGLYSSQDQLEDFQAKWIARGLKLDMGKSCIRFKGVENLPLDLIAEVIQSKTPKQALDMIEVARGRRSR
ncbi:DUF1801 domain-containing protein [bacterium]|nr:DUF1801 domain-containing protein [bacterium]